MPNADADAERTITFELVPADCFSFVFRDYAKFSPNYNCMCGIRTVHGANAQPVHWNGNARKHPYAIHPFNGVFNSISSNPSAYKVMQVYNALSCRESRALELEVCFPTILLKCSFSIVVNLLYTSFCWTHSSLLLLAAWCGA